MAEERLTMRETCEALGVSRAMVQKLEASGELTAEREGGRVLFDRDQVEALRISRDVVKVQRKQETEDREFRATDLEADRHDLEIAAWSKTSAEKTQRDKVNRELESLRAGIDELRDAERKRRHETELVEISARGDRRVAAQGSELLEIATALAPAAAILLMAYLARGKSGEPSATPMVGGSLLGAHAATGSSPAATDADLAERSLIAKSPAQSLRTRT